MCIRDVKTSSGRVVQYCTTLESNLVRVPLSRASTLAGRVVSTHVPMPIPQLDPTDVRVFCDIWQQRWVRSRE
jgi:hypothetical protein